MTADLACSRCGYVLTGGDWHRITLARGPVRGVTRLLCDGCADQLRKWWAVPSDIIAAAAGNSDAPTGAGASLPSKVAARNGTTDPECSRCGTPTSESLLFPCPCQWRACTQQLCPGCWRTEYALAKDVAKR